MGGGGYFDCRLTANGEWLRIQVKPGDVLAIPEFLWHRFACDTERKVKAMRLFKEAPKWEALTDVTQPEKAAKKLNITPPATRGASPDPAGSPLRGVGLSSTSDGDLPSLSAHE